MQLYLSDSEKNGVTVKIHRAYQKKITNEMKRTVNTVPTTSEKKLRVTQSEKTEFSWKTCCLYCGTPCVRDPKQPDRKKNWKRLYNAF